MENKQKILDNLEQISRKTYADLSESSCDRKEIINTYTKDLIINYGFSRNTATKLIEDFELQKSKNVEEALKSSLPGIKLDDFNENILVEFYKTTDLMKAYKNLGEDMQKVETEYKANIQKELARMEGSQEGKHNIIPQQVNKNLLLTHEISKNATGFLALIFGGIGAHKFYIGKIKTGLFYLLFGWTGIPTILGIVEAIMYFSCESNAEFMEKYVSD